uniref:ORF3 n=1 Tax=TTV-like mini virus TaxID=93678 RepID=A0A4Y5SS35_9VIRU|nr:ORF3 [TTV-like mini virus]
MHFTLSFSSGEAAQHLWNSLQTQENKKSFPSPIRSTKHLRSKIQKHLQNTHCGNGTKEQNNSQSLLQNELNNTLQLQNLLQTLEQKTRQQKHKKRRTKHRQRKKTKHHTSRSPSSSSISDTSSSDSSSS